MQMAKIFKPIRWSHAARTDTAAMPSLPDPAAGDRDRTGRMGIQPVTNTSPSGNPVSAVPIIEPDGRAEADEDTWLAMLELVFEATGWPDAEDEAS
jgi:hypothetical protein